MELPKNVLITGGTGLIGSRLSEVLRQRQINVSYLSRSPHGKNTYGWDVKKRIIEPDALRGKDAIIHLAGAGVADKRWTPSRKEEILKSRTESTRLLFDALQKSDHSVRHFISASAIGYYGFENEHDWYSEDSAPGTDFLAKVTRAWEEEVDKIASLGIRVVKVRIGIVLSEKGGALEQIAKPVKYYAGAPLGSGRQPVSWIHIDDVCGIFASVLTNPSAHGAYNAVAPHPVDNKTLTDAIGKALHRPIIIPSVPAFALKVLLGEMTDIVVTGTKVSAQKIIDSGYQFRFTRVDDAVNDLLAKG